jgi:hypothetical protein
MPRVKRLVGAASLLASLLAGRSACADDDVSLRNGYGHVFTDGVSYLNTGFGLAIGHGLGRHFRVEVVGLWSSGAKERASNGTIRYQSAYSSVRGSLGMSYEARLGPVRLRPGLTGGVYVIDGYTQVGTAKQQDALWRPFFGPYLESVVLVGRFELGLACEAFYVPSWPAAPTAGVYGIAGLVF